MDRDVIRVKSADGKGLVYTTKAYRDAPENSELCSQCTSFNGCRILNDFNRRSEIMDVEVNVTHCASFKKAGDPNEKVIFPDL